MRIYELDGKKYKIPVEKAQDFLMAKPTAKAVFESVQALFEQQVSKTPNHIAVAMDGEKLTYQDLNNKANQLAHYLVEYYSIQAEDLVVLVLDRDISTLVAMLAVLKAGAAYVPIDPDVPDDRIGYMLADAKPKVVLTQKKYAAKINLLVNVSSIKVIDETDFLTDVKSYSMVNPIVSITRNQLAYIIYTSGTTGNPKGVMVEQGNIVSFLYAVDRLYGGIWNNLTNKPTNYLWYSNYVFDAHIYEVYPVLTSGNTLFIAKGDMRYDLLLLKKYIEQNNIEIACIPPVLLDKDNLINLRLLTVVGDVTNQEIIDNYMKSGVVVLNGYGPTETTVCTNIGCFSKGDKNTVLGLLLSNSRGYIVNEYLQQLPDGAVGELYIAGAGVTRGYLNNHDLTVDRFIPNPFQTDQEKKLLVYDRVYKTGDLVRKLPDGRFEYVGRNDFQVKIRGFRVELGEIESRLAKYPTIKQAAVLAKEHSSGMLYLAAYYVSENEYDANDLSNYLSSFLPDYMIPASFKQMLKFPMTISGKLDRKALPESPVTISSYKEPENQLEHQLQECYAKVLGVDKATICVESNFFRQGGNSILAIKLMDLINQTLNLNINISTIFTYNTVRKFANNLEELKANSVLITPSAINNAQEALLSFAQERLKFIDLYENKSNVYNIPLIFKLKKKINIENLLVALKAVIHKHEVLRSLIKTDNRGINYQVVQDNKQKPFDIDLKIFSSEQDLITALSIAVNYLFDLESEYPININVYQYDNNLYMSIVVHHIAFDGWSGDIFIRELLQAYDKLQDIAGTESKQHDYTTLLSPLPIQYKDFALWQREYLTGDVLEKQLTFWKGQLADYEALNLPTDKLRPNQVCYKGDNVDFILDEQLSEQLREAAKDLDVSLFSLLLSGYYILLSTYSNQKDIVVGSPIANRNFKEIMDIIGFFVNSVALRKKVEPECALIDFIREVALLTTEVQHHQDLPFERLVDELNIKKDTSRHPIFQVMFSVQSFGNERQERLDDLFEPYKDENILDCHVAKFDLTTMLDDSGTTIKGFFNFATSLFNKETIVSYINTYKLILDNLSKVTTKEISSKKINQLILLTKDDYQKIVYNWNSGPVVFSNTTLVELFDEQVKRTPDHIAICCNGKQLSYGELDCLVNKLAHYLKEKYNTKPDDLVALALDRSEYIVIAILAVLKAGAAYVPMVSDTPKERVTYILKDTVAKVLLTNQTYKTSFDYVQQELNINVESIDSVEFAQQQLSSYPTSSPITDITPHHLAYIIYTSGTTGNPKGVMVEHHNVVHLFKGAESLYRFNDKDVWTLFHSYVFDFSVWELWGALLFGGRLVIPTKEESYDIALFYDLCLKEQVTILNQTPSVFYQFIETTINKLVKVNSLRYVIFGGESLNVAQLKPWYDLYADCSPHLVNMYGITETTVFATHPDPLTINDLDKLPCIGRVLEGYTGYVLNEFGVPLPIGAIGELYLGGDGVTRGYLNNKELTQERFIANPFQTENEKVCNSNGRLYKSGDLVKYTHDGQLEYIGRNDFQVKIRGFRIELEEISTCLSSYPEVKQSIVLPKENHLGEKYLVAYYVCDYEINKQKIVRYLSSYLPSYMIPHYFIQLTKFPVTVNGKLDRRKLAAPHTFNKKEYRAPMTISEKEICRLVEVLLNLEAGSVGINDNYFELGGNSIIATRLVYEINERFNTRLKIVDLFMLSTIEDVANFVSQRTFVYQPIVPLNAGIADDALLMIHPGGGGCEVYLQMAKALEEQYNCYGIEHYNLYHEDKVDNLHELAVQYLISIDTQLQVKKTYTLLGWSLGGLVALEIASILEARGVTNIHVYLLDTILNDKNKKIQVVAPTDNEIRHIIKDYTGLDFDSAKSLLLTENKLINQSVSKPLNYTNIILFKAMLSNQEREESTLYNYEDVITEPEQLTIIKMLHSSHDNILEKEPLLIVDKLLLDARDI